VWPRGVDEAVWSGSCASRLGVHSLGSVIQTLGLSSGSAPAVARPSVRVSGCCGKALSSNGRLLWHGPQFDSAVAYAVARWEGAGMVRMAGRVRGGEMGGRGHSERCFVVES
jgi:hypothetical protein